jgi:ATP-dependent Zn protease
MNSFQVTGGPRDDLKKAYAIAEAMVKDLAMSDRMGVEVVPENRIRNLGPAKTELIDSEVTRLLHESYKRALGLLGAHREELQLLAEALLQHETLTAEDIRDLVGGNLKAFEVRMAKSRPQPKA